MKKLIIFALVLALALGGCSGPAESESASTGSGDEAKAPYEPLTLAGKYDLIRLDAGASPVGFMDTDKYLITYGLDGHLRAFDLETGGLVLNRDFSSLGDVMRMEPYSGREGFDCRLCFGDRIVLLSSDDFSKSEEVFLPGDASFNVQYSRTVDGYYDMTENAFTCSTDYGIFLDIFGSGETQIADTLFPTGNDFLAETNFEQVIDTQNSYSDLPGPIHFDDPRFICDGTKIIMGVLYEPFWEYIGCAVYNIEKNAFEDFYFCPMPLRPVYPIEDRLICIPGRMLIDADDGTVTRFKTGSDSYGSYDYKTFVTYNFEMDPDSGSYKSFDAYIFDLETEEEKDFFTLNEGAELSVEGITENWFIVKIYSSIENAVYALRYNVNWE